MEAHPIADLFPRMTGEEFAELKADMKARAEGGLPPLEHPVVVYEGRILDGRHRSDAWDQLAGEDACGGFFTRNRPPVEPFAPDRHGTLLAWMRAKSANMVHRHVPADQKAAVFLKAVEQFPELKAAVDGIRAENAGRRKAGRPSGAGDRRSTTAERVGRLAGVGATTVKQVERLRAVAPDEFEEVAQGRKTVKKALKQVRAGGPAVTGTPATPGRGDLKPGDEFYRVGLLSPASRDCGLEKHVVKAAEGVVYVTAGGRRIPKSQALTLAEAKRERVGKLEAEIAALREAVRREPEVSSA